MLNSERGNQYLDELRFSTPFLLKINYRSLYHKCFIRIYNVVKFDLKNLFTIKIHYYICVSIYRVELDSNVGRTYDEYTIVTGIYTAHFIKYFLLLRISNNTPKQDHNCTTNIASTGTYLFTKTPIKIYKTLLKKPYNPFSLLQYTIINTIFSKYRTFLFCYVIL